jgi:hypothetical protein
MGLPALASRLDGSGDPKPYGLSRSAAWQYDGAHAARRTSPFSQFRLECNQQCGSLDDFRQKAGNNFSQQREKDAATIRMVKSLGPKIENS